MMSKGKFPHVPKVPKVPRLVFAVLVVATIANAQPSPWKFATAGYQFAFPRDHASHPDYKIEWWYYTGNLRTAEGRRFGYQVTFFRVGVDHAPANPSKWALRDLHMAHLAVSDAIGQRYRFAEKLSRGGPGLAGAAADRYDTWNEDWRSGLNERGQHVMTAHSKDGGVDLVLDEGKPPVINGVDGISQKGAQPGNASHYYSLTRMPTRGTISIDGERFAVTGESWMDHEFGTSFLEEGQRGWDWLSIQMSDGRELMLYQLRRADGSRDPRSSGTLVDRSGRSTHLSSDRFTLTEGRSRFTSKNGTVYPTEWTVVVPSHKIELAVTTPISNQELTLLSSTGIAYWEGMIDVAGRSNGAPVAGHGYLEMTGYHGSLGRVLSSR